MPLDREGGAEQPCCEHENADGLSPHCWACDPTTADNDTTSRTDTDTALRTADVLWSELQSRLTPIQERGFARLYGAMYSWMLDRAESSKGPDSAHVSGGSISENVASAPSAAGLDLDHIEMILDLACPYCEGRLSILRNEHLLTPQEGGPPPEYEECTNEIHAPGRAEQVAALLAASNAK